MKPCTQYSKFRIRILNARLEHHKSLRLEVVLPDVIRRTVREDGSSRTAKRWTTYSWAEVGVVCLIFAMDWNPASCITIKSIRTEIRERRDFLAEYVPHNQGNRNWILEIFITCPVYIRRQWCQSHICLVISLNCPRWWFLFGAMDDLGFIFAPTASSNSYVFEAGCPISE